MFRELGGSAAPSATQMQVYQLLEKVGDKVWPAHVRGHGV